MMSTTIGDMLAGYFPPTVQAIGTLYQQHLLGHTLIVIYATIDTVGLLDAPPTQSSATGASFQAWVKKYLLGSTGIEFNETDLWAARCSVLHTFTTESDLSRQGKARQLQYFSGDKANPAHQHFVAFTRAHEGGRHVPVHIQDLCDAVVDGLKRFVPDLEANCRSDDRYTQRLRKVLQVHPTPSL